MSFLLKALLIFVVFFAAGCALPFIEKWICKFMERRRRKKCSEK